MRRKYYELEMEICFVDTADILTLSGGDGTTDSGTAGGAGDFGEQPGDNVFNDW